MNHEHPEAPHAAWNRRRFLGATTVTATSWISFPRVLAAAFQEPRRSRELPQPAPRTDFLLAAAAQAFEQQKPLLVMVVPRVTLDRLENQSLSGLRWGLGQWISSNEIDDMLDLGLFVPACGTAGDLNAAFQVQIDLPQPLLLWLDVWAIEDARANVRSMPIYGSIDSHDQFKARRAKGELPRGFERPYFDWIAHQLAQMLRHELECRGEHGLAELALRTRSSMTKDLERRIAHWIREGQGLRDDELRRYTALLRSSWRGLDPDLIAARRTALAKAIRTDLLAGSIPGATLGYVGRLGSCGAIYKDEQSRREAKGPMGPCGTASLPLDAREFLILVSG